MATPLMGTSNSLLEHMPTVPVFVKLNILQLPVCFMPTSSFHLED